MPQVQTVKVVKRGAGIYSVSKDVFSYVVCDFLTLYDLHALLPVNSWIRAMVREALRHRPAELEPWVAEYYKDAGACSPPLHYNESYGATLMLGRRSRFCELPNVWPDVTTLTPPSATVMERVSARERMACLASNVHTSDGVDAIKALALPLVNTALEHYWLPRNIWSILSANPRDDAVELLLMRPERVCFKSASRNTNGRMIRWLVGSNENLKRVDWVAFSRNPSDEALDFLMDNPKKVRVAQLSTNRGGAKAGVLMEAHLARLKWNHVSANSGVGAVNVLKAHPEKIRWMYLAINTSAFALDAILDHDGGAHAQSLNMLVVAKMRNHRAMQIIDTMLRVNARAYINNHSFWDRLCRNPLAMKCGLLKKYKKYLEGVCCNGVCWNMNIICEYNPAVVVIASNPNAK